MLLSSHLGNRRPVAGSVSEDGVRDGDAAACEGDDGLVMGFAFGALAGGEGFAGGGIERAEGGLKKDALECLVFGVGAFEVADFAGLLEHGRQTRGCGEPVWGCEALDRACLGDELGRQRGTAEPSTAAGMNSIPAPLPTKVRAA